MEPTEEDFLESDPEPKPFGPLQQKPRDGAVFNAAAWLTTMVSISVYHWQPGAQDLTVSGEAIFQREEYWRLFSALFVHADLGHLISNAPLFALFGWLLFGYFGRFGFPLMSVLVGAMANLVTVWYYPAETKLLGASGMVYGMVGLWLFLYLYFDVVSKIKIKTLRAIGFALCMLFPSSYQVRVSYLAHGSGLVIGLLAGVFFIPMWRSMLGGKQQVEYAVGENDQGPYLH